MDEMRSDRFERDRDILFSRAVKAGKRVYYVDIKRNRRGDNMLSITESKKIYDEAHPDAMPSYERHKVFIYEEDFDKMLTAINEALAFAKENSTQPPMDDSLDDLKIEF